MVGILTRSLVCSGPLHTVESAKPLTASLGVFSLNAAVPSRAAGGAVPGRILFANRIWTEASGPSPDSPAMAQHVKAVHDGGGIQKMHPRGVHYGASSTIRRTRRPRPDSRSSTTPR